MRFMMLMIPQGYATAPAEIIPSAEAVSRMRKFNKEMGEAGILLALDGLHPPSAGVRVAFPQGKPVVTHGPFAETHEAIGGFWIINVASLDEAVAWARRCPCSETETIEVRRVMEWDDFPPEIQKALGVPR